MSKKIFFLRSLFRNTHKATISTKQIADLLGVTAAKAEEYAKRDIETGMVIKIAASSTYYLTFEGLRVLYRQLLLKHE